MTIAVDPLGKERVHDRDMYLVTIDRLGEWPEVRPRFDFVTTLIALDARELADAEILDVADQMIRAHCGYVSAWGPDCERVHDLYDDARLLAELGPEKLLPEELLFLMTTSHADETLHEALWYALHALPTDRSKGFNYEGAGMPPFVAVTTSPDWAHQIRRRLLDRGTFAAEILSKDSDQRHN